MNIFTAVKYCCILHGRVFVMMLAISAFETLELTLSAQKAICKSKQKAMALISMRSRAADMRLYCISHIMFIVGYLIIMENEQLNKCFAPLRKLRTRLGHNIELSSY